MHTIVRVVQDSSRRVEQPLLMCVLDQDGFSVAKNCVIYAKRNRANNCMKRSDQNKTKNIEKEIGIDLIRNTRPILSFN